MSVGRFRENPVSQKAHQERGKNVARMGIRVILYTAKGDKVVCFSSTIAINGKRSFFCACCHRREP